MEDITFTYYVSPTGNDTNSGTEEAPFRTLKRVCDLVGYSEVEAIVKVKRAEAKEVRIE